MEFIKDYECVINYHSRKSNVVTNALSRKNKIVIGGFLVGDKKELSELANLGVELSVEIRGRIKEAQKINDELEKIRKRIESE